VRTPWPFYAARRVVFARREQSHEHSKTFRVPSANSIREPPQRFAHSKYRLIQKPTGSGNETRLTPIVVVDAGSFFGNSGFRVAIRAYAADGSVGC
jgi:hypothetical protein